MAKMKRIGALWKGKPDQKAKLSGNLDFLGEDIRIGIFLNTDENKKENGPDYYILRYSDLPNQPQQETDNVPF